MQGSPVRGEDAADARLSPRLFHPRFGGRRSLRPARARAPSSTGRNGPAYFDRTETDYSSALRMKREDPSRLVLGEEEGDIGHVQALVCPRSRTHHRGDRAPAAAHEGRGPARSGPAYPDYGRSTPTVRSRAAARVHALPAIRRLSGRDVGYARCWLQADYNYDGGHHRWRKPTPTARRASARWISIRNGV
jgi:hypothetical protein